MVNHIPHFHTVYPFNNLIQLIHQGYTFPLVLLSAKKHSISFGNVRCKGFMHIPEFGVPHIMMRFFVVAYLQCITSYSKAYHQWAQNDTELNSSLTSMCELFDETHVNYLLLVGSCDHEAEKSCDKINIQGFCSHVIRTNISISYPIGFYLAFIFSELIRCFLGSEVYVPLKYYDNT